jgi:SH3 domain-containing YSC84-like protein 1
LPTQIRKIYFPWPDDLRRRGEKGFVMEGARTSPKKPDPGEWTGPGTGTFQKGERTMQNRANRFSGKVGLALVVVLAALWSSPAWAADDVAQQGTVDKSLLTFQKFMADKRRFRDNVKDAKALLIIPRMLKAGLFLGGSAGSGVLVARDEAAEKWSQPAFYTVRSVSLGAQVGGEVAEVILMIRSRSALEALYKNMFKLGGDASVAAGPLGVGTQWNVAGDVLTFARCQGLFIGLDYDGSVIRVNDDSNKAYCGKTVSLADIIAKNAVSNPGSEKLSAALKEAVK